MQEDERRTLGSELRDVVGQHITAIATRLRLRRRMVKPSTTDAAARKGLHSTSLLASDAHLHLREVVEHMNGPAHSARQVPAERALPRGPPARVRVRSWRQRASLLYPGPAPNACA